MILNKTTKALMVAFALAGTATSAFADAPQPIEVDGGTIRITGSIVESACAITTNYSNEPFQMGALALKDMQGAGTNSAGKLLNISLSGCDLGGDNSDGKTTDPYSRVSVSIDGMRDSTNSNLIAISSDGNTAAATGVALQVLDDRDTPLTPGVFGAQKDLAAGANQIPLKVRYVSTQANPTAGSANGEITFKVRYE